MHGDSEKSQHIQKNRDFSGHSENFGQIVVKSKLVIFIHLVAYEVVYQAQKEYLVYIQ